MPNKSQLYNRTLRNLGEEGLSGVTEEVTARYRLDAVYDEGLIDAVLEEGLWNFAMRTQHITYDPGITPDFGFRYAINKPSDYIRLERISADEYLNYPLTEYQDDAENWMVSVESIYVRYVSNDAAYGGDLSLWPPAFFKFASWYFAKEVVEQFTHNEKLIARVEKRHQKALLDARNTDCMNQPPGRLSSGSWSRSRRGGSSGRRDGGNSGQLIG